MTERPRERGSKTPGIGIAAAARRTGLSQEILRAWERRYDAVRPLRTATGRRRYREEDLERLTLLRRLTASGHRIGDVASLPVADLQELAEALTDAPPPRVSADSAETGSPDLLASALRAIEQMDARTLESVLEQATLSLSRPHLRSGLIAPLMREIGLRWASGSLRVVQEHLASAVIRSFLLTSLTRQPSLPGSPLLVSATPSKQLHEIGALLAATHAQDAGWEVLHLGADLPAEEIAAAAARRGARAALLSLIYPLADPLVSEQLLSLRRLLDPALGVIVVGRAMQSYAEALERIGALRAGTPAELSQILESLAAGR